MSEKSLTPAEDPSNELPEYASSERSLTPYEVLEEEFIILHKMMPPQEDPSDEFPEYSTEAGKTKAVHSRLAAIYRAVHGLNPRRAALCLSGGGIRSATFSLGVLQGFARHGWLPYFHYLSTVSGGGYIGSWLNAWIRWSRFDDVEAGLRACEAPPNDAASLTAVCPEPQQISWLRAYSNYLSPRLGFSADFWTLIAVFFRNLLLHWVVLIPLLAAALMLPRLTIALAASQPQPPDSLQWIVLVVALAFGAFGIAYVDVHLPCSNKDSRTGGGSAIGFLLPFMVCAFLLSLFWAWYTQKSNEGFGFWTYFFVGIGVHAVGVMAACMIREVRKRSQPLSVWRTAAGVFQSFLADSISVAISGAFGGIVLWVISTKLFPQPLGAASSLKGIYFMLAVPSLFLALSLGTTLYIGLCRQDKGVTEDDREWWARAGGYLLIAISIWVAGHGLVIYGPPALLSLQEYAAAAISVGGLAGVLTAAWGYWSKIKTFAKEASRTWAVIRSVLPTLGAVVFSLTLLLLICVATSYLTAVVLKHIALPHLEDSGILHYPDILMKAPPEWVAVILLLLAGVAVLCSMTFGINTFSLHSMYGNRLVRAYLGASRNERRPNPFTGFDPDDNVRMSDLGHRPFHVVNLALNLVRGDRLEWQQRKAESFTVSPLHSGSFNLGYRPSETYGGEHGMSLGKAMTISGAAASPNMGYHSSKLVAFLMTFFNVRLGWWLPNPGRAGDSVWKQGEPCLGIYPLLEEAFGQTNDRSRFVYLSDGGHFENLALYEMVYRRCGLIVVVDGACDPKYEYEDLASAIRKIRTDMGIPITFDPLPGPGSVNEPASHFAVGKVEYSKVDGKGVPDGTIIYVKPALSKGMPLDVKNYAVTHNDPKNPFPQQSTRDQFFDEAQFESYRQLGEYSVEYLFARHAKHPSWSDPDKVFSRDFNYENVTIV